MLCASDSFFLWITALCKFLFVFVLYCNFSTVPDWGAILRRRCNHPVLRLRNVERSRCVASIVGWRISKLSWSKRDHRGSTYLHAAWVAHFRPSFWLAHSCLSATRLPNELEQRDGSGRCQLWWTKQVDVLGFRHAERTGSWCIWCGMARSVGVCGGERRPGQDGAWQGTYSVSGQRKAASYQHHLRTCVMRSIVEATQSCAHL